jgi:broad specificity phosphatase PhoE
VWLVRHGRPLVDRSRPAHDWPLDPAYADDVTALRPSLPVDATWFSSPEPKALGTARLLTGQEVLAVDDLREHERSAGWVDDFPALVRRAFEVPDESVAPGWEPLADCRDRVVAAYDRIRAEHQGNLVLVGHGTAWTLLSAHLVGGPPDLDRWENLALPDVIVS